MKKNKNNNHRKVTKNKVDNDNDTKNRKSSERKGIGKDKEELELLLHVCQPLSHLPWISASSNNRQRICQSQYQYHGQQQQKQQKQQIQQIQQIQQHNFSYLVHQIHRRSKVEILKTENPVSNKNNKRSIPLILNINGSINSVDYRISTSTSSNYQIQPTKSHQPSERLKPRHAIACKQFAKRHILPLKKKKNFMIMKKNQGQKKQKRKSEKAKKPKCKRKKTQKQKHSQQSLEKLSNENIQQDQNWSEIFTNNKIVKLRMTSQPMEPKSSFILAQVLPTVHVISLDLSQNILGNLGAINLAKTLNDTKLVHLYLRENKIGSQGFEKLSEALVSNSYLRTLDISNNNISGSSSLRSLQKVFEENKSLNYFNISGNGISKMTAMREVCDSLKDNPSLYWLKISRKRKLIGNVHRKLAKHLKSWY